MSRRPAPPLARDAAATAALAAYTLAIAVGFARVFSGWAFMRDLALIAIVVHGLSFAMRRARISGWITVPVMVAVGLWLITVLDYRDTLHRLLPGSATWDQITVELSLVRDRFPTAVAPVFYGAGWAPLAAFALVLVLVMSDSFAFRADARGEALVPGGVLFVFVAALGSGRLQITSAVLLVATGVVAVIALRQLHEPTRRTVLSSRTHPIPFAVPAALASGVCIAVLAGLVGPQLPGARAEPLYDTSSRSGTNLIDSPFVDIRSRLTNLGDTELFRVNADQPEYWRVITLAEFDGQRFRLPERPLADFEGDTSVAPDEQRVRQKIQILGLQGELVPAAAEPVEASLTRDGEVFRLSRQPDSSTLISPSDLQPADQFDIVSVTRSPTPDQLRAAGVGNVPDPVYLELPDNLPDVVYEQTAALTADAATPFDAALAIQSWFRDPNEFRYSLEVQAGHSSNAIESFFRNRAGYCEQFAATFATMARIAGIPSRVAVGYTPGVQNEPGWYSVIGKNAHAWPELWFDGFGWLMFEPTPGRGAAAAESYTGVPAQQDESGPTAGGAGDGTGVPSPTVPPTVVPPQPGAVTPTTTIAPGTSGYVAQPDGGLPIDDLSGGAAADGADEPGSGSFPWPLTVIGGLLAIGLVAPWVTRRIARLRRRAHAGDEQVIAAWGRAQAAAADAGVAGTPSMTPTEWTTATTHTIPVAASPMRNLADVVDRVMFSPPGTVDLDHRGRLGDRLADECDLWANEVCRMASDMLPTSKRVRRYFVDYR